VPPLQGSLDAHPSPGLAPWALLSRAFSAFCAVHLTGACFPGRCVEISALIARFPFFGSMAYALRHRAFTAFAALPCPGRLAPRPSLSRAFSAQNYGCVITTAQAPKARNSRAQGGGRAAAGTLGQEWQKPGALTGRHRLLNNKKIWPPRQAPWMLCLPGAYASCTAGLGF
jgi:hypothetical protein